MKIRLYGYWFAFWALLFSSLVLTGCWHTTDDVIILDNKCVLTKSPRIFIPPKKISRNRETASVLLYFPNGYSYRDGIFKLNDGRVFNIKVSLIDENGIRHDTKYYGRIGDAFAANFTHLDENIKIISVEISSTIDVPCERIVWHCFTAIFG